MNDLPTEHAPPSEPLRLPPLTRQAWNLAQALMDYVADGCKTVDESQYRERLEICDACSYRRGNRCVKCGCYLSFKARGRAFHCPAKKWPLPETRIAER